MGLVVVAMVLTFSRGSFMGFIVVNVLFLLWRRNVKTLIFGGLLAAVALLLVPGAVHDRVTTGFGSGLDSYSAGRIDEIWLPLLPEVLRSPIYGQGLGSILWSEAMRSGAGITIAAVGHAHNAYLQALLDMGIAGLILVCAYFAHVWKEFRTLGVDPAVSPTLRGLYLGGAAALATLPISLFIYPTLIPVPHQPFLFLLIQCLLSQ